MELLDIEKELAGADKEAAMKKYDEELVALQVRLREALRVGLGKDEFTRAQDLDEVVTIARKLLRLQIRN